MYIDGDSGGRKKILADAQIADGRMLAMWGDAGWGQLVRQGKTVDGRFDDRLVEALAELVEEWAPHPAPQWVTSVPSLRHPELVATFAERLADRLGLPYHPVVARLVERPEQNEQQNSPISRPTSLERSVSPAWSAMRRCSSSTMSPTQVGR